MKIFVPRRMLSVWRALGSGGEYRRINADVEEGFTLICETNQWIRARTHYRVRGLEIRNTRTDLPIKKGLSSSAAISVLTARAFNRVYDLRLTAREEMELAYQGEIATPSRCGRTDQACAFGDHAVMMEFDDDFQSFVDTQISIENSNMSESS